MNAIRPASNSSPDPHLSWRESAYVEQLFASEAHYLRQALKLLSGPRVLQIGCLIEQRGIDGLDLPQLIRSHCNQEIPAWASLTADPAFLPLDADSISGVILPHMLEAHELPHQVLREVHRVLRPDGCLLLTGFNPFSLVGLQRYVRPAAVYPGHYYSVRRVMDWLQLLGFEVVSSAMYQYAPLSKSQRLRSAFNFLNSVGDRWLPMFGGGYMICAKKRDAGLTLVGQLKFSRTKQKLGSAAAAKVSHGN